ncbi:Protein EMP47 [Spathaspora sp. JA1]|nr:Protein EMP47 [Spathaspora sp. JA1]
MLVRFGNSSTLQFESLTPLHYTMKWWVIPFFLIQLSLSIEPGPLSLPTLLDITEISQLSSKWLTFGNIRYDVGRLLIDSSTVKSIQGQGAIWSKTDLSDNEWTIEYIFRTSGTTRDLTYSDINGLSLWLVDSDTFKTPHLNYDNFGGPHSYDGFQILVSNEGKPGVKIFNNDGSKPGSHKIKDSVGNCQFHFLDSSVPFTVRVSYSEKKKWFKVQVDNNLCFKTNKILLPKKSNFKFGITGKVAKASHETYEILGLKVWDHLTEDAIDDHGLLSDGDSDGDTATVVVTKPSEPTGPSQLRQSLLDRARKHREEEANKKKQGPQPSPPAKSHTPAGDMRDINSKLEKLESLVNLLQLDINRQQPQFVDFNQKQVSQKQTLDSISQSVTELKTTFTEQYTNLLSAVAQLNQKVIGEVREQHYGMQELSKKVDLLMANHKEVKYQYEQEKQDLRARTNDKRTAFMDTLISWILVPLVIILLFLLVIVYRLRHDIKHSKLL